MTYDDGAPDQNALIARIAAESASEHVAEEENLKLVRDTFSERMVDAIDSGEIVIPDAVATFIAREWDKQNERARSSTRRLLHEFASGQMAILFGSEELDTVRQMMVAAGRNRRTTVALFNEDDAFRVLDETLRNQAEVNQAAQNTNADVMASLPYLRRNGSIGQAIDAADIPGLT